MPSKRHKGRVQWCNVFTYYILRVWRDLYFGLFSSIPLKEEEQSLFLDSLERRLYQSDPVACEGLVTEAECLRALVNRLGWTVYQSNSSYTFGIYSVAISCW